MRPIEIRDIRHKEKYNIDDAYLNGWAKIIKPTGTAIYNSLCRHADIELSSYPSIKLLAKEHGISEKSVQRAIKKLKECNLIAYEQVRNEQGKWLRNKYFLLDKSVWESPVGQKRPTVPSDKKDGNGRTKTSLPVGHSNPTKDTHIEGYTYKDSNSLKRIAELRKKAYEITGRSL